MGVAAVIVGVLAVQPTAFAAAIDDLRSAFNKGDLGVANRLLDANNSLAKFRDVDGETLLIEYARSGDPNAVSALLKHGADPNAVTGQYSGQSALHQAVLLAVTGFSGRLEKYEKTIDLLVSAGADPDRRDASGRPVLGYAVVGSTNGITIAKLLIRHGADPNRVSDPDLDSLLHMAAQKGTAETVEWLISYGLDPKAKNRLGSTPLHLVSGDREARKAKKVELLVATGADVNSPDNLGRTPLHAMCREDGTQREAITLQDQLAAVRLLIAQKSNPNAADDGGGTPLHGACVANNVPLVKLLISLGADPNHGSKIGLLPLGIAVSDGRLDLAAELLSSGAGIERREGSFSILERAILRHNLAMVEFLIQKGANVNSRGAYQSPLYLAQREGVQDIAKRLIAAGARL